MLNITGFPVFKIRCIEQHLDQDYGGSKAKPEIDSCNNDGERWQQGMPALVRWVVR
jgi:hypothetical protein